MIYLLASDFLLADGPGEKLLEEGGAEIGALFLLGVIALSVYFFVKRAFTAFIGFALFAMFVGVFVFNPELIKTLGNDAFNWLFADWIN